MSDEQRGYSLMIADIGDRRPRHPLHVYDRVRNFHRRRHKVPTRGTREFSGTHVFGELGVLRLERPKPTTQP